MQPDQAQPFCCAYSCRHNEDSLADLGHSDAEHVSGEKGIRVETAASLICACTDKLKLGLTDVPLTQETLAELYKEGAT